VYSRHETCGEFFEKLIKLLAICMARKLVAVAKNALEIRADPAIFVNLAILIVKSVPPSWPN
jgi:hypothetical protein